MFTMDNASNNNTHCQRAIKPHSHMFGGREYQIHCSAHILNLVVKVSGVQLVSDVVLWDWQFDQAVLSQFSHKIKQAPVNGDGEASEAAVGLKVEMELDTFEEEISRFSVGDEEFDFAAEDSEDEIAAEVQLKPS